LEDSKFLIFKLFLFRLNSAAAPALCTGRRKRASSLVEDNPLEIDLELPIRVSKASR